MGSDTLTLEEAVRHIDTTRSDKNIQLRQYVASWINVDLVYQEARRKGIENSASVNRQLEDIRRQLATQSFLEQYVYNDTTAIPDDTLRSYFGNHATEFFIREDVKQLNIALINSREKASAFSATIAQGTPWGAALAAFVKDSSSASTLLSVSTGKYYTVHTIVPQEIWKVTQSLSPGEVSYPVRTAAGYIVVQTVRTFKQGGSSPFDLAKDEIFQRILLDRRRKNYDEFLRTLRNRYPVQVYFSPSIDSAAHHE